MAVPTAYPQLPRLPAVPARSEEFQRLYLQEYTGVAAYAWQLLRDRETAHDIAQEAFTRLFSKWLSVQQPRHYLYRITTNLIRDSWTKRQRDRDTSLHLEAAADSTVPPADIAAALAVQSAVLALPPRLRPVVLLHYFSDLPLADIAAALDRPVGTVKRQLHEAREALAAQLQGADDD